MDSFNLSDLNSSHHLSTDSSIYNFKKMLPSNPKIFNFIYEKDNQNFLVKYYNYENSLKDLEKEKKFANIFSLNQDLSLAIYDKKTSSPPYALIYSLEDFLPLSEQIHSIPSESREPLMLKLLDLLSVVHSSKVIHSTLNLETILLSKNLEIKLIGFENCLEFDELPTTDLQNHFELQEKSFKAPELLDSGYEISEKIDVWSLGYTMFQLHFPEAGTKDHDPGNFSLIDSVEDQKLRRIFEMVFEPDPMLRPGLATLKKLIQEPVNVKIFTPTKKYTYDLVKLFMTDKSSVMLVGLLVELGTRIRDDTSRSIKLKQAFLDRRLRYPRKVLKALFLLHWIWNELCRNDCGPHDYEMIGKVKRDFESIESEEFKVIIQKYFQILQGKVELFRDFNIRPDFLFVTCLDSIEKKIFGYLKLVIDLVSMILFEFSENPFLEEVAKLLSKEIVLIFQIFLKDLKSLTKTKTFFRLRSMAEELIQKLHQVYPGINLQLKSSLYLKFKIQPKVSDLSMWLNHYQLKNQARFAFGSTCEIFTARYKGKKVAIKSYKPFESLEGRKPFKKHLNLLENSFHENIVIYLGYFKNHNLNIVTEFCSGNALDKLLERNNQDSCPFKLTLKQKLKIASDIAHGLHYLHNKNPPIIHRNIKSSNILLALPLSSPSDIPKAKITDFGNSTFVETDEHTQLQGSQRWMAPEVYRGNRYDEKCDVYSFAIVLWEIFSGKFPYEKGFNIIDVVQNGVRPDVDMIVGSQVNAIKAMIRNCWESNPKSRPSFSVIIEDLKNIEISE